MFLEFDLVGGSLPKKYPILTFDFLPSQGPGVPVGPSGWSRIKESNKTRIDPCPILAGVPFTKNVEIPKFWSPLSAPPSGPLFSGHGPKLKILVPTFCSPRCPNSEKVQHNPPAPKPREEIYLAETRFFRVRAWPRGPQGPSHMPKNYLRGG